ncbi:MAG: U32 family peptidase [Bacteroidales bacterium]|nr:U32 family peptidase [Bacteroidales bacterium]
MEHLELLAPARNLQIGIAAIDCGADAVYIAGPGFGARHSAGNPVSDIEELCRYAHKFGARIFVTVNTILFDKEIEEAGNMMEALADAGADAFIVQDLAVAALARERGLRIPLHASTQCAIRTVEDAKRYETLGFSRLVLERQMSLDRIREIREAVSPEIEFFVHGALCVCYSGQCYLSQNIEGRSANRGECIQACRSKYDLVDGNGKVLLKDKAILSLKDYNLLSRLGDLADAGVCSFKIEGRLKNLSYVRNVVREYSLALDDLIRRSGGRFARSSFGKVTKGFSPKTDRTFNRGYTSLFIDGNRGKWSSMDTPKGMGEEIGRIESIKKNRDGSTTITLTPKKGMVPSGLELANGDGFSILRGNEILGFRGDVCSGLSITCRSDAPVRKGDRIWRNLSQSFEKEMDSNPCIRQILVKVRLSSRNVGDRYVLTAEATSEDGRKAFSEVASQDKARNPEQMKRTMSAQIGKSSGIYSFLAPDTDLLTDDIPFLPAAAINGLRRSLADELDSLPCNDVPMKGYSPLPLKGDLFSGKVSYKWNCSNSLSRKAMESLGAESVEDAYELSGRDDAELMRSKYCVRFELGMCPVHQGASDSGPLFLLNNGRKYSLGFDCGKCEMTVKEYRKSVSGK